jgi:hypothetical protein
MGVRLDNARFTTQYIGRYTKRPVMSESRIKGYDGQYVMFEYEDKTEKKRELLTLSAEEFLKCLIRHIHDKHFRAIRHAGIYATRTRKDDLGTARSLLKLEQGKQVESQDWRQRRQQQNASDPLICHYCGSELVLVKIVYRARDGTMKEHVFKEV